MPKTGGERLVPDREEMSRAVAKRLAEAIRRTGRSQTEIAADLGVSPSRLSNWVNSVNEPPFGYFVALCRLTDVSADEILGLPPRGPARLPDQAAAQLERQLEKVAQRREAVAEELEDLRRLVRGLSDKK